MLHGGPQACMTTSATSTVRQPVRSTMSKAVATLAHLSGSADLAVMEFLARLSHTAAVLSSEHSSLHGYKLGSVERYLRHLVYSDLHAVRPSLPKIPIKDLALVGNRCRDSTDGSAGVHSFRDRGFDRGGTHRAHGRCGHRLLFGSDYSVMPSRPAGNDAHVV